jgi:hypothetical protein
MACLPKGCRRHGGAFNRFAAPLPDIFLRSPKVKSYVPNNTSHKEPLDIVFEAHPPVDIKS